MARCADDTDMYKAESGPVTGDPHSGSEQAKINPEDLLHEAQAERARHRTEEAVSGASAGEGPTGETVTPGAQRRARAASKSLTKLIDAAREGMAEKVRKARHAMQVAAGLSVGDVSNWLNMSNRLYKYFVDSRADFHKWVMGYAQDPKLASWAQPLIAAFNQMPDEIRAKNSVYEKRRRALLDSLIPLADRTGRTTKELADALGHYAVLEHIPEANARLLQQWADDIAAAPDKNAVATKMRDYNELLKYLDATEKPANLRSAGYTNGEAAVLKEKILKETGVTRQEAEAFTQKLRAEHAFLLEERVRAGSVTPKTLASFPDFAAYVPLYSKEQNMTMPVNAAFMYNPGSYHMRDGMRGRPDSAWSSLLYNSRRTATELGMQDFAIPFAELAKRYKEAGWAKVGTAEDRGLRVYDYDEMQRRAHSGVGPLADEAESILNSGGIVVDLPEVGPDGSTVLKRQYVYFKSSWEGNSGLTGFSLNKALTGNYKEGSGLIDWLGKASSWHGQLFTRFTPLFAPIGGFRDGMERCFHLLNRTYYNADGNTVTGASLVPDFMKNSARAARMLYDAMSGRADENSDAYRYWKDFQQDGVFQHFTSSVRQESTSLQDMLKPKDEKQSFMDKYKAQWMDKWLRQTGRAGETVVRKLDAYNDYLQNLAAFNQYVVMRERGISREKTAQGVLEMMNFQQRGTLTPLLRVVAPFVVPTMQSTAAVGRTLGLGARTPADIIKEGYKGWLGVLTGSAALGVLYEMARDMMGQDENGVSYFDSMPIRTVSRFLPIAINDQGEYVKFPLGYGPVSLASALAVATDRVWRGLMEPTDAVVDVMFAVAKDCVPTNMPQYNFSSKPAAFIGQLVTPDVLKPLMEVMANTNYFGSEIYRTQQEGVSRADSGKTTTDVFWHNVARKIRRDTGIDMAPEEYQYLAKAYFTGPMRLFGAAMDSAFDLTGQYTKKNESNPSAEETLGPWLGAIGANMWYSKVRSPAQSMYFRYKEAVEEKISRLGIKMTDSSNSGKTKEEVDAWRRQKLEDSGEFTPEEIDDYILMRRTGDDLRKLESNFTKQHKDSWMRMENVDELREVFEKMFSEATEYYNNFITQSDYYRNFR